MVDPDEQMRVFAKLPHGAHDCRQVEQGFRQRAQDRLTALTPQNAASLQTLREVVQPQLEHVLEACAPPTQNVWGDAGTWASVADLEAQQLLLGRQGQSDRIAATAWRKPASEPNQWLLAVHAVGREGLLDACGTPGPWITLAIEHGWGVLSIDALETGTVYRKMRSVRETSSPETILKAPRHDHDWFWLTFNPALLGQRVQDILTGLAYLKAQGSVKIALLAPGAAGAWAVFAAALSPHVDALAADLAPETDGSYLGPLFCAGFARLWRPNRSLGAAGAPQSLAGPGPE